ncbi:unnamed protein product [Rodentolepis nana]|uniref:Serine/threonine-protein phosphatase 2A regulatory subunit B'' subunit gamma n=1 Tax=Rodentolepis nana TaxID=102285 RepID=A0A0R3TEQ2_RODNA|nr:unnamed protein product [Rodentolepis nana]
MFRSIDTNPTTSNQFFTKNTNSVLLTPRQRCEAEELLLESRGEQLPDDKDLNDLWNDLEKMKDASVDEKEWFITYPNFLKAKQEVSLKVSHFFTAPIFAKISHAERLSRINIHDFFAFVKKTVCLQKTRIALSKYDHRGDGYLQEVDLESYITDLIPSLCHVNEVDEEYKPFYISFVVRTFLFFLDPLRAGRIRILDVLASELIEPLFQLANTSLTQAQLEENPLTIQRVMIAYTNFLLLDTDRSGMLSREELNSLNDATLTDAFLDGVFQSCLTYGGEMDFRVYVDLMLAIENRKLPQSIAYFFRIVDSGGQGRLCVKSVEYLVKSLFQLLPDEPDARTLRDVVDEIFDMVQPQHPGYITLEDLLKSGHGHTVLAILTDAKCYMEYKNRDL